MSKQGPPKGTVNNPKGINQYSDEAVAGAIGLGALAISGPIAAGAAILGSLAYAQALKNDAADNRALADKLTKQADAQNKANAALEAKMKAEASRKAEAARRKEGIDKYNSVRNNYLDNKRKASLGARSAANLAGAPFHLGSLAGHAAAKVSDSLYKYTPQGKGTLTELARVKKKYNVKTK